MATTTDSVQIQPRADLTSAAKARDTDAVRTLAPAPRGPS